MAGTVPSASLRDTFPKLLLENVRVRGDKPANREKDYGIWLAWSWAEIAGEIRALVCGLQTLGVERGDKVCICGDNRPHLYWALTAVQALGAVPVPVYQDSVAEEMQFIYAHAEAKFAIVENQEQVDKLLEIRPQIPALKSIIYNDSRGMMHYQQDFLYKYSDVQDSGRRFDAANPGFFVASVEQGAGSDVCAMLYTSGTTGRPKGVMLSFDNLLITANNGCLREGLSEDEETLAYLPMAWIGDNIFSHAQAYCAGYCVSCPESSDTVLQDLREIGPTYFFAPPRIYESLLTTVMIRIEDAAKIKQSMFHYFMAVAKRVGMDILDGKPVALVDRLLYGIGNILVYGPLKNVLGLSKMRVGYTAGEAIGPDIFAFYRSMGLNLKQLYASTEASVFITIQPDGEVNPESSGTPAIGVEVRIADDGEVMFKSPGVFQAYFKDDEATRETKTEDGWVHTGDAGYFDEQGHLRIIDRSKDVGKLRDGTLFAPKFLENKLKFFPHIKEAVTFGDGQDFVTAFINIDLESVGNWAERRNIAYSGYTDLAGQPAVYDLIQACVEQINNDLAADAKLAGSQIHRFLLLHKQLEADDGELTRTSKLRRAPIAERYADLITALYAGKTICPVEVRVTYEDGRTDTINANVEIRDAATTRAAAQAAE
ncbi:MAG: AMP-binding protein [Rhodospirillales bacterium]|nr:AMP-binding protein [Rhodospirillales bacterium]